MKKIYFSVVALGVAMSLSAQDTITFENVLLEAESFNNGSTGSGGFIENGVVFSNTYTTDWGGVWNGFSVSNITDNTTAGWGNQYSAFTGSGDNSTNYGIYNPTGTISFAGQGVVVKSVKLTNTTYAATSMRDGDSFAKQFGSPNDANGNPDGTNGEDYFRLWIYAHSENGAIIDSTVFYLADYRFSDDNQDYIVDTWETVDLSFITETVYSLSFNFESTDVGQWGINTPLYFAIDNLVIDKNLGITENAINNVAIYPNPFQNELFVQGGEGQIVLTDLAGKIILDEMYNDSFEFSTVHIPSGVYYVTIRNSKGEFTQKVIK